YQENLEDPEKKRWSKQNKEILDAIRAEIERRKAPAQGGAVERPPDSPVEDARQPVGAPTPAAQAEANPTAPSDTASGTPTPAPAGPKNRGQLLSDVYTALNKAAGQRGVAGLLRVLCRKFQWTETTTLSDLSDLQLAEIAKT